MIEEKRRVLITGIAGQDGSLLAERLAEKGSYEIFGIARKGADLSNIKELIESSPRKIHLLDVDMRNLGDLERCIRNINWDIIWNLGAISSSKVAEKDKAQAKLVNVDAPRVILDAISCHSKPSIRFIQASSTEIYSGLPPQMITEESPLAPKSFYGMTKAAAHIQVKLARMNGVWATNATMGLHESVRRPSIFVLAALAAECADAIKRQDGSTLQKDVNIIRDWGCASDYIEALEAIGTGDSPEDYLVVSGIQISLAIIVREASLKISGFPKIKFKWTDGSASPIDASKIKERLGWAAKSSLVEVFVDMVKKNLEDNNE